MKYVNKTDMESSVMDCSSGWASVSDAASCEFVSPADRISYLVSLVNMPSQGSDLRASELWLPLYPAPLLIAQNSILKQLNKKLSFKNRFLIL